MTSWQMREALMHGTMATTREEESWQIGIAGTVDKNWLRRTASVLTAEDLSRKPLMSLHLRRIGPFHASPSGAQCLAAYPVRYSRLSLVPSPSRSTSPRCWGLDWSKAGVWDVHRTADQDGSLEGLLDGPGAVCVRHLSRASALAVGGLPRALLGVSQAALEALEADLIKFIRHRDHRFAYEPWGKEGDAWKRAVERTIGRPEW